MCEVLKRWDEYSKAVRQLALSLYQANGAVMGKRGFAIICGFWGLDNEERAEWAEIASDVLFYVQHGRIVK